MAIFIMSRSDLKLGHVGPKTRSLGQILKKPRVHSKRHSFDPKFMNLCQILIIMLIIIISRSGLKLGHVRSKTRSLSQILEKASVPFKGHSFDH